MVIESLGQLKHGCNNDKPPMFCNDKEKVWQCGSCDAKFTRQESEDLQDQQYVESYPEDLNLMRRYWRKF